jgi:hypothetical protein
MNSASANTYTHTHFSTVQPGIARQIRVPIHPLFMAPPFLFMYLLCLVCALHYSYVCILSVFLVPIFYIHFSPSHLNRLLQASHLRRQGLEWPCFL